VGTASKVLLTGAHGFTGVHLCQALRNQGMLATSMDVDLTDPVAVSAFIAETNPDYVIHMGAVSFVAHPIPSDFYNVNVVGTLNLLDALKQNGARCRKVILASSASVYGKQPKRILDESMSPRPVDHYGCSKFAMECMAMNYSDSFRIIIARPFNYTGPGQGEHFAIPKIVNAYQKKKRVIELGNLNILREFNDVRSVCSAYCRLLDLETIAGPLTVNLCSGKAISLMNVIELMNSIAGYELEVKANKEYMRPHEIKTLAGCPKRLTGLVGDCFTYTIEDTLRWMYVT
jgi:GDP-6-deoxy-D-talose 4-dehydrogenase